MIYRYRRWQWVVALVLCSNTTGLWAQLPSQKGSPFNQIGRSWGFGISDGYHECPECNTKRHLPIASPSITAGKASVPCKDCNRPSWFSKMHLLKTPKWTKKTHRGTVDSGSDGVPMTLLPPSPETFQQFSAPAEIPLPGSTVQPNEAIPQAQYPTPVPAQPSLERPVTDPIELKNADHELLNDDSLLESPQAIVPPPPEFQSRPYAGQPLDQAPSPPSIRQTTPSDSQNLIDESSDLLPKDERPPFSFRPQPRHASSLISHTRPLPQDSATTSASTTMLRQYYGNAYNHRADSISADQETLNTLESRPVVNRYR